jgi:hypothetical protein
MQIYRLTDPIRDAAFTGAGNAFISASRPNSNQLVGWFLEGRGRTT